MPIGLFIVICILSFILGTLVVVASENVVEKLSLNVSIFKSSSFCCACKNKIKWYDQIPLISYLFLKGKCRYCKNKIDISYFFFEFFGGISFLLITIMFKDKLIELIFILPLISVILMIAFEDFKNQEVHYSLLIIYGIISITYIIYKSFISKQIPIDHFIGLGIGLGSFLLIALIGWLISKKMILGEGDIIYFAITGFFVGDKQLIIVFIITIFVGTICEYLKIMINKLKDKETSSTFALCPYLVVGTLISIWFGEYIINFVLKLFS